MPVSHQEWWLQAPQLSSAMASRDCRLAVAETYQFGDGLLEISVDDPVFRQRFQRAYHECRLSPAAGTPAGPRVRCTVCTVETPQVVLLSFDDPEVLDLLDFSLGLFPGRGYRAIPSPVAGWRTLASPALPTEPFMMVRGNQAIIDRCQAWQAFVGSCAVNRVLRLQRQVLFFHAASVGIGALGLLLTGPKGAGKTTTSLTLTSRGHHFLGDEIAAVRRPSNDLVPFRRAVSIRPGPCARRLDTLLHESEHAAEVFPDGTTRVRASIRDLFPAAEACPVPLRSVLFLRQFAAHPRCEPFHFALEHLRLLQPLSCTLWGVSPGRQLMEFLALFAPVHCAFLDVGDPEETADLIESMMEGL